MCNFHSREHAMLLIFSRFGFCFLHSLDGLLRLSAVFSSTICLPWLITSTTGSRRPRARGGAFARATHLYLVILGQRSRKMSKNMLTSLAQNLTSLCPTFNRPVHRRNPANTDDESCLMSTKKTAAQTGIRTTSPSIHFQVETRLIR